MDDPSPFEVRRAYDASDAGPGARVLVDRLWPRGVTKDALALDAWLKDVAPSTELRRWYGHEPDRFPAFAERYREELAREPAASAVRRLEELGARGRVVLLTATRDVPRSGAQVLLELLRRAA